MAVTPSANGNTIILFDSGSAFVVRSFSPTQEEKYRIVDTLGRTQEEKRFLDSFERIFIAASTGDLKKCQNIVEKENFNDIDAYSIGKFSDQRSGKSLDKISPRQIAQINGYSNITDYFSKRFDSYHESKNIAQKPVFNLELASEEDKKTYESHKKSFEEYLSNKETPYNAILDSIRANIMNTYSFEERIDKVGLLKKMNATELLQYVEVRCEEEFTSDSPYEKEKRLELYAMRDCLKDFLSKKSVSN